VGYDNLRLFLDYLQSYQIEPLEEAITEELEYHQGDTFKIQFDTLSLNDENILTKIALSHAIAQNVKLEQFEKQIQQSIEANSNIPLQLAQKGEINLRKHHIAQKIGELFLVKSKIYLHYDLLDTPEFLWEYPEFESYYESLIKYLDIRPRIEVLNKKVEVVQELLDMLVNQQNHRYSSFLEWIIIVLILVEIVISLIEHFSA